MVLMKRRAVRALSVIMTVVMLLGNSSIAYATDISDTGYADLTDTEVPLESIDESGVGLDLDIAEDYQDDSNEEPSISDFSPEDGQEDEFGLNQDADDGTSEDIAEDEMADDEEALAIDSEVVSECATYAVYFAGCEEDAEEYELDREAVADKEKMSEYSDQFAVGVEGKDYVPNVIIVDADSEEEAEVVAELYSGRLISFMEFCALIELNADSSKEHATVSQAVQASMSMKTPLPAAWPDYYRYSHDYEDDTEQSEEQSEEYAEVISESAMQALSATFTDPYLKQNNAAGYQWHHSVIGSQYAWVNGYTGDGIKVTVIDSGLGRESDGQHEDLNVPDNRRSFTSSKESHTYDKMGHGTHVSGLVGASLGNGKGGSGVAPGCELYSINADGGVDPGHFTTSDLIKAINRARSEIGTDIINMSLGGIFYQPQEEEAVKKCYEEGIAVFISAGNTDADSPHYPALTEGAICIAALDKGNQKSEFSCYGKAVKFAFPGVDIYSSVSTDSSSYESYDGTSMASPIAAGTAAVILQWARANGKISKTGKRADVDALVTLMKKGAVSVKGSGLGAGYVSIPKAMGLSTHLSKPNKVVFAYPNNYIFASTSENITITGEKGTRVYYSLNGKNPAYKNGIPSNYTGIIDLSSTNKGTIEIKDIKQVTIRAIAVNNITKAAGAVSSVTYKLQPPVSGVSISSASGNYNIAIGGKLQLKATISPAIARNTAVTWEAVGKPEGITVSSSGLVTVKSTAKVSTFQVKATSKDVTGKSDTVKLSVVNNTVIKTIKPAKTAYNIVKDETLSIPVTVTKSDGTPGNANANIAWSVLQGEGITGNTITATTTGISIIGSATPGKTIIQGIATDGSSATTKITITNKATIPVTGITITGDAYLAPGKSNTYKAVISNTNASNKKLAWSVSPADSAVTISSSGKLTAKANAMPKTYTVKAQAMDGSEVYGVKTVTITSTKISSLSISTSSLEVFREKNLYNSPDSKTFTINRQGGSSDAIEVVSSNPSMLSVSRSGDIVTVTSNNKGTGKVTVTVRTTDGTNLKKTCTVNIVNPPSALTLSVPSGRCNTVAYKKTMTLVATLEQEYGAIASSAKKLKWTSSNPNEISVDQKGKVTAKRYMGGSAVIKAETTDGSNLAATFTVYNCDNIHAIYPYYALVWNGWWGMWFPTGQSAASVRFDNYGDNAYDLEFLIFTTKGEAHYAQDQSGKIASSPFSYSSGTSNATISVFDSIEKPSVYFKKKGTYTIKIKSKTGDNKTGTFKMKLY